MVIIIYVPESREGSVNHWNRMVSVHHSQEFIFSIFI